MDLVTLTSPPFEFVTFAFCLTNTELFFFWLESRVVLIRLVSSCRSAAALLNALADERWNRSEAPSPYVPFRAGRPGGRKMRDYYFSIIGVGCNKHVVGLKCDYFPAVEVKSSTTFVDV